MTSGIDPEALHVCDGADNIGNYSENREQVERWSYESQ